ncbi:signal peptidase I [Sporomusa acidovorans]|uniref:Signal peptidase I n=1 Tax=Sporomusa acidovorans (strain ATCC 49682 / DSM 3132 / Mol) TaxID=1123286 RepID=A0ABZ3IZ73_SPOA4|nr:signal peptidase I [Sporomusa acidovorans]OZC16340.1 signal peptidase I S [Sporomusa acidovorans DSM 3132]SDF73410.1 signal peptidase I [Sporomusa acidovorans]
MKLIKEIADWTYSLVIALALAIVINAFVFQPTRVVGSSMEPNLHNNDYVFVSKLSHTFVGTPDYNDIVIIDSRVFRERSVKDDLADPVSTYLSVAKLAEVDNHIWIKRVIGKPGDTIEIKDGQLYRNGTLIEESYIREPMHAATPKKVTIPSGQVYVLGDNRNNSSDSRYIGPVPISHVLGKVVMVL